MSQSIIVSGNRNYGLAAALAEAFPQAEFFSRSTTETDLARYEQREEFAEKTLNYDVYISCSCLSQFRQTLLLEKVYKAWKSNEKSGQIICFGSTADTPVKGTDWVYPIEKKALRAYCRNLSMAALGGHGGRPSGIRVTYISPGYISTPKANDKHPGVRKIDTAYLASLVQWLLDQPSQINISELCLDPIQESNELP